MHSIIEQSQRIHFIKANKDFYQSFFVLNYLFTKYQQSISPVKTLDEIIRTHQAELGCFKVFSGIKGKKNYYEIVAKDLYLKIPFLLKGPMDGISWSGKYPVQLKDKEHREVLIEVVNKLQEWMKEEWNWERTIQICIQELENQNVFINAKLNMSTSCSTASGINDSYIKGEINLKNGEIKSISASPYSENDPWQKINYYPVTTKTVPECNNFFNTLSNLFYAAGQGNALNIVIENKKIISITQNAAKGKKVALYPVLSEPREFKIKPPLLLK